MDNPNSSTTNDSQRGEKIMTHLKTDLVSAPELERFTAAIESFGGELLEIRDADCIVMAFDDLEKMMVVVDGLKANAPWLSVNSKNIDGRNVVTFSKIRGKVV
jgi:hypothetical protein